MLYAEVYMLYAEVYMLYTEVTEQLRLNTVYIDIRKFQQLKYITEVSVTGIQKLLGFLILLPLTFYSSDSQH